MDNQIPREDLSCEAILSENGKESDTEFEEDKEQSVAETKCNGTELDLDSTFEETDSRCELKRNLANWAVNRNISHSALTELLHILAHCGLDLPKDSRSLLSTPKTFQVKEMGNGIYYHFGVANAITSQLLNDSHISVDTLTLRVNIDGLPLFRSSKMELWPILAIVKEIPKCGVIIIGLYAGSSKPASVQEYLNDFIEDLKSVTKEGFLYKGKHFNIALPDAFVCDAPARAFLKCVKGHSGYSSCERCAEHGIYLDKKVVFPDCKAPLRTDEAFEHLTDEDHHHGVSPLQDLGIGMVSSFVLDYMHLVCLGHVKKVISLWIKGPLKCRLSAVTISIISNHMKSIRDHFPRNFSRKPRSLMEYSQWKATEFRQFLLYTGPVVLQGRLSTQMYNNFLLLSVAIRILLSPALCCKYCDYADRLLKCYVANFAKVYGTEHLVYNTHCLVHLADDARKYGALDNISCFPFENYLGTLKRLVRRPQNPLQQVIRRVAEKRVPGENERKSKPQLQHTCGPTLPDFPARMQFRQYKHEGIIISCSVGNNCFDVEGKVAVVRNIVQLFSGAMYIVCQFYDKQDCFCRYPTDLSCLGIRTVAQLSDHLYGVPVTNLTKKLVLLPLRDGHVVFPQLHDQ
ncbi:uncharacterized protein [Nothobranchius furzeri]|uniref:uncharacterized protein n=1 Tax=Nothobranchius furzeri TaxID=105023 RepID=UPI0039047C4D